jgi:hypothetical protein
MKRRPRRVTLLPRGRKSDSFLAVSTSTTEVIPDQSQPRDRDDNDNDENDTQEKTGGKAGCR